MRQYITRRLLEMIPVLLGISIMIFAIFQLAPGDPISAMVDPKTSAATKAKLREQLHLNEPIIVQYKYWIMDMLKGNWGESFYYKQPVTKVIHSFLWNSFYLSLASFILGALLSIPIGVLSATKQYSKFDYIFTVIALIGISMPSFFFGLLLIKWFAVDLKIFPVSGMTNPGSIASGFALFKEVMYHMALPLIVLTFGSLAGLMRYTRSSMLEVIRQDYIRTARAKGLREKVVIYKHALRNALIPVVTIFGMSLPGLFSGAIITEQIFNWPGIGPIELQAVNTRDYYLLMGINMMLAFLTLLGNLIADVTYAVVDPRIRLK
ncbi:MAG: ABC transporter permease [Caloramator sp.]|nr:ABC transporter permease [Caloramator sp.]